MSEHLLSANQNNHFEMLMLDELHTDYISVIFTCSLIFAINIIIISNFVHMPSKISVCSQSKQAYSVYKLMGYIFKLLYIDYFITILLFYCDYFVLVS